MTDTRTATIVETAAKDAIALYLEYRDVHGCDEEQSRTRAVQEVAEGIQAREGAVQATLARVRELLDASPWGPTRAQACRTLFEIRQAIERGG